MTQNKEWLDKALHSAIEYKKHLDNGYTELKEKEARGEEVDPQALSDYEQGAAMSIDEIKFQFLHQASYKGSIDIPFEEFVKTSPKIGMAPQTREAVDVFFNRREKEYFEHYKLDRNNPGIVFIVRQIIHDELQVNQLRQDLALHNGKLLKLTADADTDDLKKKIIDSIAKVNKTIFEFTKYLDAERVSVEQKEIEAEQKEKDEEQFGLSFDDFLKKAEVDQGRKKAVQAKKSKVSEYLSENLETDSGSS